MFGLDPDPDPGGPWAVFGIRDILVRSGPLTNGSGSGSGSDSFLQWLSGCKKLLFFSNFFLITYPEAHYLQSLIYCFKDKFCVKILFCQYYFSPFNTFMRKGQDPDREPDPNLWLPDPGFCVKILFCQHYFSPFNTFMRKGQDPDREPDPNLWLTDPGGPKTLLTLTIGF